MQCRARGLDHTCRPRTCHGLAAPAAGVAAQDCDQGRFGLADGLDEIGVGLPTQAQIAPVDTHVDTGLAGSGQERDGGAHTRISSSSSDANPSSSARAPPFLGSQPVIPSPARADAGFSADTNPSPAKSWVTGWDLAKVAPLLAG